MVIPALPDLKAVGWSVRKPISATFSLPIRFSYQVTALMPASLS